jgi:PAS domain S-box-containing protein
MPAEVLSSWKEIAAFLGRGRRTVQRWEKELRLPVRRLGGRHRGTVFAWPLEIEGWLRANPPPPPAPPRQTRKAAAAGHAAPGFHRTAAAAALRSRELLDLISEHGHQAFAVFDREMRYLHASRRWITERGLEDIEIIGLSHYDLFPEIPQRWRTEAVRCLAGESASSQEDSYLRPDGRRMSVRWALYPWHQTNGDVGGLVLFVDRTDPLKRVTRALLESEERYRALLAAAGLGVLIVDKNAVIQECNSQATHILGYPAEELVGVSVLDPRWQILGENGDHFGGDRCPAVIAMRSGEPQHGILMGFRRPSGRLAWISVSCHPLFRVGNSMPYSVMAVFSEVPNRPVENKIR